MTDNEIIKALDCWSTPHGCTGCPFIEQGCFDCGNIPMDISNNILDLINRQKAEIERLKGSVITNNVVEISKIRKTAKSEAIKKFAEKLKNLHTEYDTVTKREIDSLAEEMTESEENDV